MGDGAFDRAYEALLRRFSGAVCHGELEQLPACTEAVLASCELKDDPGCPRRRMHTQRVEEPSDLLVGAGVPEVLRGRAIKTLPSEIFLAMKAGEERGRRILVLYGETAREALGPALYLLARRKGLFLPTYRVELTGDEMRRAELARLVVVHDLGQEIALARPTLYRLINWRADHGLWTACTAAAWTREHLAPEIREVAIEVNV